MSFQTEEACHAYKLLSGALKQLRGHLLPLAAVLSGQQECPGFSIENQSTPF